MPYSNISSIGISVAVMAALELTLSIEHNSLRRSSCHQSTPLIVREEPSSKRDVSDFDISATNNQNVEWVRDNNCIIVEATRLSRPSLTL